MILFIISSIMALPERKVVYVIVEPWLNHKNMCALKVLKC